MAQKLSDYVGVLGQVHNIRDSARERYLAWKEEHESLRGWFKNKFISSPNCDRQDYSHIFRAKTRKELIRISAAVMGIEFSYAAETAFVSPTLLKIGVEHKHMTLVWALSPLIGFFLTPILGSLSDRCHLHIGRRRPFIFIMSLGVLLGLILVPNGERLGYAMGDELPPNDTTSNFPVISPRTLALNNNQENDTFIIENQEEIVAYNNSHPWGVFFTVLGTVLLDFDADACQSPARAYLLDVTIPEDHARGLSTFTVMAGLGGFLGYALGGINWDVTAIGVLLGGHVRAVFTLITVIFVVCVSYTITSFREMPLALLELRGNASLQGQYEECVSEDDSIASSSYGAVEQDQDYLRMQAKERLNSINDGSTRRQSQQQRRSIVPDPNASLLLYLKSIIYMPRSIRMVCLTNLFCWMAHVCYSLYFTDFVGEAVFQGNPTAPEGDPAHAQYEAGVRFGCWGMSMYSLSCACYSTIIERLIERFGARKVYIGGLLFYSTGMCLMALTKHKVGVILFSWTAGVMYSTLFTMPYLIIAHYHASGTFELTDGGEAKKSSQIRGLGTDVALVSSMVFLAQFILSMCMGTIVSWSGTTTAVVSVASTLAFFGALSASRIMYLDL